MLAYSLKVCYMLYIIEGVHKNPLWFKKYTTLQLLIITLNDFLPHEETKKYLLNYANHCMLIVYQAFIFFWNNSDWQCISKYAQWVAYVLTNLKISNPQLSTGRWWATTLESWSGTDNQAMHNCRIGKPKCLLTHGNTAGCPSCHRLCTCWSVLLS